jgi:hypothetical protein
MEPSHHAISDSLKQTIDPPKRGGELHDAAGTGVVAWVGWVDLRWIAKIFEGRLTGENGTGQTFSGWAEM